MQSLNRLLASLLILLFSSAPLYGQSYSIDGNRWYEIEVSIFTNQSLGFLNAEQNIPGRVTPVYPDDILQLKSASSSLAIDFEVPEEFAAIREFLPAFSASEIAVDSDETMVSLGPEYSPATNDFKINDFATDAFIALGSAYSQFEEFNQDISRSRQHRLLYHAVWRQPVLNKIQSSAIFVKGGDQYGQHSELEGSITISFNVNRIDVDANLWFNSFTGELNPSPWIIPLPPFTDNANTNFSLFVEDFVVMQEVRSMVSNSLHYMDHPTFGLLVEVRPYQLPVPTEID